VTPLTPIYTADNCTFCAPLEWGLSVFWRTLTSDSSWFADLQNATEADDLRILGHRFAKPGVSQFTVSTKPGTAPVFLVQRVKGRLQYLVRQTIPKALRANYGLRSFGRVTRETTENYVANQLDHHSMADERVQAMLGRYQIVDDDVDLSQPRQTSQGRYWYNLHLVLVHRDRWAEVREEVIRKLRDMVLRVCKQKGYALSRGGLLTDHMHLALGCPLEVSTRGVASGGCSRLLEQSGLRPRHETDVSVWGLRGNVRGVRPGGSSQRPGPSLGR